MGEVIQKRYYEMDEVAEDLQRPASTIRFWESEMPFLAPAVRGSNNKRKYQTHEVVRLQQVSFLMDFGMTVKGVVNAHEKGFFDKLFAVLNQFKEEL